jgi:hypothetical protein
MTAKIFLIYNIIFPKGFLLHRAKEAVFVIKSWGFLKNFKIRSCSYLGLGLICQKGIKISLDCPFNIGKTKLVLFHTKGKAINIPVHIIYSRMILNLD